MVFRQEALKMSLYTCAGMSQILSDTRKTESDDLSDRTTRDEIGLQTETLKSGHRHLWSSGWEKLWVYDERERRGRERRGLLGWKT